MRIFTGYYRIAEIDEKYIFMKLKHEKYHVFPD